jgi:hypothetical protein
MAGIAAIALALGALNATAAQATEPDDVASATSVTAPAFGANVKIFDPSMTTAEIQTAVDAIAAEQVDAEFTTQRYALLFKPGTYGTPEAPLSFEVGYYTEVAGLGASPTDVTINGTINVFNRCLTADNCIALTNFWRSLSNLQINVTGGEGCRTNTNFWAASQAAPMRRVKVNGGLSLMDYCTAGPQYASGGFIADSVTGNVTNGSQQQYLVRNSTIGTWSNGVWNQVFSGVDGAPTTSFPDPPYTTLDATPLSREKPYLYIDADGKYRVFVPAVQKNSSGTTWEDGSEPGTSISLSKFYIAKPGVSVKTINSKLAQGYHLLLSPGVYDVASSINVKRTGTIVLGMGLATLTAQKGATALKVGNVGGVVIAGLTIDAGSKSSSVLLQVGTKSSKYKGSTSNPTTLSDVFFRIGGPHIGKAKISLEVNSDKVLLDHLWVWRADHGQGWGWKVNTTKNGVVVNGDNVTATGLFVEHFHEYNTIWSGENGRVVFYQNELPYDAPTQASWKHGSTLGWAAYKVGSKVKKHELWGGGAYIYTNVNPDLHATRGFEVPVRAGVKLHSLLTVNLGAGTIDHVVNNTGDPVNNSNTGTPSYVVSFN